MATSAVVDVISFNAAISEDDAAGADVINHSAAISTRDFACAPSGAAGGAAHAPPVLFGGAKDFNSQ
eukprot:8502847-Karenia_brevis.AAC.1